MQIKKLTSHNKCEQNKSYKIQTKKTSYKRGRRSGQSIQQIGQLIKLSKICGDSNNCN